MIKTRVSVIQSLASLLGSNPFSEFAHNPLSATVPSHTGDDTL